MGRNLEKASLNRQQHQLADAQVQLDILEHGSTGDFALVPFQQKLEASNLYPLTPSQIQVFQVNVGKMCNQVCKHCHVDAGPDRKEIMTNDTMLQCLALLKKITVADKKNSPLSKKRVPFNFNNCTLVFSFLLKE